MSSPAEVVSTEVVPVIGNPDLHRICTNCFICVQIAASPCISRQYGVEEDEAPKGLVLLGLAVIERLMLP